jgi:3',5'-cyclic AMP phosphodiesterase CpdA
MFTLAHLSDPHLAPLPRPRMAELMGKRMTGYLHWHRTRRYVHETGVLSKIVADMKAQNPDHIAVVGDLTNVGLAAEFAPALAWLDSLGGPQTVSVVPGNHDVYVREKAPSAFAHWVDFIHGDDGGGFPYLRRRGPLALVGLSSAVATAPFLATGLLGKAQLDALADLLAALGGEALFRVVLIHHPPLGGGSRHKRLVDAAALKRVIAAHGADLILHGHDHRPMTNWLDGPDGTRVPAVGVPSASAAPARSRHAAAYNLYRIEGAPGAWRCELVIRGIDAAGTVGEQSRTMLAA